MWCGHSGGQIATRRVDGQGRRRTTCSCSSSTDAMSVCRSAAVTETSSPPPACSQTDIVLVVDRSGSLNKRDWNEGTLPFLSNLAQELVATLPSSSRMGMVIFPSESGGNRGDKSGNAKTIMSLQSLSTVASDLEYHKNFLAGQSSTFCKSNPKLKPYMPCDSWGYNPFWLGLQVTPTVACARDSHTDPFLPFLSALLHPIPLPCAPFRRLSTPCACFRPLLM